MDNRTSLSTADGQRAFRDRLPPRAQLLEIGAGTWQDSVCFQQEGCAVVAADLSPVMVEHCRAKGIEAYIMNFLHLGFSRGSFDASPRSSARTAASR